MTTATNPIARLERRVAAYREFAGRGTDPEHRLAARRAEVLGRRLAEEKRNEPYEWHHFEVPGSGGHGKARYDALTAIVKAHGCILPVYGPGQSPRFPWGDFELRFGGRGGSAERAAEVLPDLLREIDAAAAAAVKAYNAYLKTLPEEDHDPKWRVGMRRRFRRDYIAAYGRAVAYRIQFGENLPSGAIEGYSAHGRAALDAANLDMSRLHIGGYIRDPLGRARYVAIHAPEYIQPVRLDIAAPESARQLER
ncbi:hypothetical protein ACWEN6_13975 [Sphaerisporangium sp. NPDC004334]